MDLILGGAYQGKLTWVAAQYGLREGDVCDLAREPVRPARCYTHLEALTAQGDGQDALPLLLAAEAVISREIGCGVVPVERQQRQWRERHGKLLRRLAQESGHVYRIFCGLKEELK